MSVTDELTAAVAASTKLDAGTKSILTDFLTAVSPSLATLTPEVLSSLMGNFASGNTSVAIAPLAAAMSASQVADALATTTQELTAELAVREQQAAAAKATISAIETMALSILAKAIIGAL